MNKPPFHSEGELYHKLCIPEPHLIQRRRSTPPPIRASSIESRTQKITKERRYLPGQPRIALQDPGDPDKISSYLETEFVTKDLNKLEPLLWLVAKQDSSHISSLTHQIVRGREIIVTENPGLHLVWFNDQIYIKPIPKYLLSHAFWEFYLISKDSPIPEPKRQAITDASLGFLRSYFYLIQHKSDFLLAMDARLRLLPKDVSHSGFIKFIAAFEKDQIDDTRVSPRYQFGELRLSRLNFWSKIFLRRLDYQRVYQQYSTYFARFYGPILFLFGVLSVALSAMQVALAVQPLLQWGNSWTTFAKVSRWFSVSTLLSVALVTLLLLLALAVLSLRETVFALGDLWSIKSQKKKPQDVEGKCPASKSA